MLYHDTHYNFYVCTFVCGPFGLKFGITKVSVHCECTLEIVS